MNLKAFAVAFALTVLVVSSAFGQITKSGNAYLFRMKFVKGQTMNYAMNVTSTIPGASKPQTMSMPMSMTVTDVTNGIATIKYKMTSPMGGSKPQEITVKMDNTGKLVSGSAPSMNGISATLPKNPVAVGGSWKNTTSVPSGAAGNMNVTNTYKFLGFKTVNGKQVANISVSMSGKSSAISVSGGGTMLLSVADGSMVNTAMNVDTSVSMQGGTPMKMAMKVNMVRK